MNCARGDAWVRDRGLLLVSASVGLPRRAATRHLQPLGPRLTRSCLRPAGLAWPPERGGRRCPPQLAARLQDPGAPERQVREDRARPGRPPSSTPRHQRSARNRQGLCDAKRFRGCAVAREQLGEVADAGGGGRIARGWKKATLRRDRPGRAGWQPPRARRASICS